MAWSYATFVNNLTALSITGVTRSYTSPPKQVNTADLPALWPQLPSAENNIVTFTYERGLRQSRVDLIIAVEPYDQNTSIANFAKTITLLDNVESALYANAMAIGIDRWSIEQGLMEVAPETMYWILAVTVEGSGTQ